MPRLIGIEWDHQQLRVLEASSRGGKLEVGRARSWAETVGPNPAQAEEAGLRLRERLKEAGMAPGPALFVVGRDRLLFREVRYPDVPAAEVPAVVHFQASKELNFPADEAVVDYVLSTVPGPLGEKRALAVVVRRELLTAIQKTCKVAGLRLEGVAARPFALLAASQTAGFEANGRDARALLVLDHAGGEVCVARGKELLFSRSLSWDGEAAAPGRLLAELRRTLAAYTTAFPGQPIGSLHVANGEPLTDQSLSQGLHLPARSLDPLGGVALPGVPKDERARFAGVLGAVQARLANRKLPVDFLAPKQAHPKDNRKRRYVIAVAAAVLLLVVGVSALYGLAVSRRNGRIEELTLQNARLARDIAAYGDIDKRLEKINEWAGNEMVILDELYDLTVHFPDQPGLRITKVEWKPIVEPLRPAQPARPSAGVKPVAKPVEKPIGELTLEATGEPADLARLHEALKAGRHWKLDFFDALAGKQARAKLRVFRQKPSDYTTVLPSTPAPRGERSERGGRR